MVSGQFFCEIIIFCFVVDICYLVHNVEAIFHFPGGGGESTCFLVPLK